MGLFTRNLIEESKNCISIFSDTSKKLSEVNKKLIQEEERINEKIKKKQLIKEELIGQNKKNLKIIEKIQQIIE